MPIGAIIPAVGSIVGGLMGSAGQNAQANQNANLQNQYLANYGAGQNAYRNYLSGLGPQTSYSNNIGNYASRTNQSQTSSPFITAQFQPMINAVTNTLQNRLSGPSALPAGYAAEQVASINNAFKGVEQANQNRAAQFGISGPQATASNVPLESARAGQIGSAMANLPLLERQMSNEDMNTAASIASIFGRGQQSTGTSNTSGSQSSAGSFTAPPPIAPYQAFLPPGPQQGGVADPTLNFLSGAIPGLTSGASRLAGYNAYNSLLGGASGGQGGDGGNGMGYTPLSGLTGGATQGPSGSFGNWWGGQSPSTSNPSSQP